MKSLLTVTAIFEATTGIGLILMPSIIVPTLLGISFIEPGLHIVSAITGAALISIGIACWLYRNSGLQAVGLVKALSFYNVMASMALLYGVIGAHLSAIGLWPAIIVHAGLTVWCFVTLGKR